MSTTPNYDLDILIRFVASFTGLHFHDISGVDIHDGYLEVDMGGYFDIESEFHSDFFVKSIHDDGVLLYFEFPVDGWSFLHPHYPEESGSHLYNDLCRRFGETDEIPKFLSDK